MFKTASYSYGAGIFIHLGWSIVNLFVYKKNKHI